MISLSTTLSTHYIKLTTFYFIKSTKTYIFFPQSLRLEYGKMEVHQNLEAAIENQQNNRVASREKHVVMNFAEIKCTYNTFNSLI